MKRHILFAGLMILLLSGVGSGCDKPSADQGKSRRETLAGRYVYKIQSGADFTQRELNLRGDGTCDVKFSAKTTASDTTANPAADVDLKFGSRSASGTGRWTVDGDAIALTMDKTTEDLKSLQLTVAKNGAELQERGGGVYLRQ